MTEKLGWDTDQKSKAYAIDTLKKDLKEGRCIPHSHEPSMNYGCLFTVNAVKWEP